MAEIGKYAVILPKAKHIQHTFGSYEEALDWMKNTSVTGYIAVIVAKVVNRVEVVAPSQKSVVAMVNKHFQPQTKANRKE